MDHLLKQKKLINSKNQLHHPKMGELKITHHFRERLMSRFGKSVEDVSNYLHTFKHQSGTKRCPHLRVVYQKISSWNYPNSDYLYNKGLDMVFVYDRYEKVMITVLHFNNDEYYNGHNKIPNIC